MKILVCGASGMLGNAVFRLLSEHTAGTVIGTARSESCRHYFPDHLQPSLITGIDVEHPDSLLRVFAQTRPDVVINCIGLVKQVADADDPLQAIPLNAMLPHRLATLCKVSGSRLIHISTDCVFSGQKGGYTEDDVPDAVHLYGRSKLLGEVTARHTITLRTSIIGTEQASCRSLIGWFLAQHGSVKGFRRAVFSGLPTVELAAIIREQVLPRHDLHGLYHVAAEPIDKDALLRLVAAVYGKAIQIEPSDDVIIDRSLDASRFRAATGYTPPPWPELIRRMHAFG